MKIAAIFLGAFVAAALGIPLGQDVIHEQRSAKVMTAKVIKRASADAEAVVPVRIALKQRNVENGMDYIMDVSDPASKNYGNHFTQEQIVEMFSPSQESIDSVKNWLIKVGVPESSISLPKSKGWLDFKSTVGQLENILKTNYHIYENPQSRSEHLGTDSYVLPAEVSKHVDFVTPAVAMARINKRTGSLKGVPRPVPFKAFPPSFSINAGAATQCDSQVTPQCIKALYNIPNPTSSIKGNQLGMFESQSEMHKQSDLNKFFSTYSPNIPQGTGPKIDLIDWGNDTPDPSEAGGEAALDFDMAYPLVYPQSIELYQTNSNFDGNDHLGFLNQFLDAVDGSYCTSGGGDDPDVDGTTPNEACGTFKPANVISFSYGLTENAWPTAYIKRQCDEFMKLGLQGTSVVFASGDGGVAGGHGGDCLANGVFNPANPGSCPYVTSVGATILPTGSQVGDPEVAVQRFGSGGGFSNVWTTPDYQSSAVSTYFSAHDPGFKSYNTSENTIPSNGGIYNRAGRGFPDIAAAGDFGVVVFNGQSGRIGGTSMACPIIASVFNRINEERLAAGKKVIGFANPALYKNPAMFHDVTSGNQAGGNGACNGKSFSAVKGWDPVTGLGTPNYPAFSKYFASL